MLRPAARTTVTSFKPTKPSTVFRCPTCAASTGVSAYLPPEVATMTTFFSPASPVGPSAEYLKVLPATTTRSIQALRPDGMVKL
jgi:hypothetical protein